MSDERVIELVRTIVEKETYLEKQENGTYRGEIYVDYRDELSSKTIEEISNSGSPREEFYDKVTSFGADDYEYDELLKTIKRHWIDDEENCYTRSQDLISDWVYENVCFDFPYDHYLGQEVNVDILVNTGDGNYDYTLNNFCDCYAKHNEVIDPKSSILWLVRQQGYNKRQLNRAVRKGDYGISRFLKSIHVECENVTTHMNALAFFVKMTLGEFIDYLETPKDIIVSEKTGCGLYDPWNGAGGPLEIELEKPVTIPSKYVELTIDGDRGYSVDSIYGMRGSFWKNTLAS